MALVSRPVEIPVTCPSPARVGSTGTIHYLLQKERPRMDQSHGHHSRGSTPSRPAREFVQVCREVVSVSCGQPLLSHKPKRSKSSLSSSSKVAKTPESKQSTTKSTPESSARSLSGRIVANAVRLAGTNDVLPIVDSRVEFPHKASLESSRSKLNELSDSMRCVSLGEGSELAVVERKSAPASVYDEHEENVFSGEYPVYQVSRGPSSGTGKPLPEDYHKALIPFLRAEWEASAKILKRRQFSHVPKKVMHRRSTSLGSSSTGGGSPASDEKAWQSYSRDSYPPLSSSRRHTYVRLPPGESL
ncbi:hypothetical protein R1flu_006005 [Riccia fluitans]|uniref:Uncharacterized protein n=1 Tax=Riccia fluitans TaxID=41844 RepID=A0ABD1YUS4_9MARC